MPRTFDQHGNDLGGVLPDSGGEAAGIITSRGHSPDEPLPAYVLATARQDDGTVTWYYATDAAYRQGRIDAAIQTLQETGATLVEGAASVGNTVIDTYGTFGKALPWLLLGAAVLFLRNTAQGGSESLVRHIDRKLSEW